jgi:hypothetical protein
MTRTTVAAKPSQNRLNVIVKIHRLLRLRCHSPEGQPTQQQDSQKAQCHGRITKDQGGN